ncbi:hypothetical protein L7F22_051670 [Adiantum nelumboides]|nr:hypothetical protein [Adiantum nelumboides]
MFTNFIFQPFFGKSIRVFLDDFCTYSDRALHCQKVEEGLQRLYQYGGQLNPDKCHVAEKEVVLLGHVISQEGIKVDPSRVQAIFDLPPPNSARQVITFVQKVRYMSCFIHLLSQIISPLQKLANQEVFSWEQEHLECFNEVKEVLGSLATIMPPDPQGIYYLCPSVGLDAFGAVLMQKDPRIAYMRPIYFTSKVMTQGQKGYTDIEQLVFSLIVAIRKLRSYLLPKPFIILTLEHNLPYAIQHMSISSKISKWVLELQEYEYTFIVEDSTRASLADVLTYKVKEKKITPKAQGKLDFSPQGELEDAYTLLFDGAYRRQRNKAAGGFVILNEEKKEVLKKGIQLHLAHSNNEAEYATLKAGLEECKSMGIRRLMVKGDALLIVRQVQGTWACKNSKLLQWLHEVKLLMKDFEAIQIQHISRQHNKEADNMANTQFEVMVGAIKFKEPPFKGQETMEDILYFLEIGECPKHLERVQRHRLVRKALSYQLIGKHLYHKGKDLVLRRVPLIKEIEKILMSCHDGVCGGHFAQEITSRKILQAGFVWPSLHRDVQHWCKACKACQQAGDRKLSYGPRFPIFAYGPFEKWGIDAIGPLPCTSTGKQYILTATDYMTRWAEAASVARITATDVSKFILDYICSRFGTPLEILFDRGPGFRADLLDALLENLSIKHVHYTPYYPQCNGLVEKTNGVLYKIITKHVRDRPQDWDKHLTAALWAYRTSFKVSTQFTPYHLVYGQEALLPIEVELGSLRVLVRETTSSKEKLEQRILDLQRLELDREAATDYYITQANKKREQFNNKVKEKKVEEGMLVMSYTIDDQAWIPSRITIKSWVLLQTRKRKRRQCNDFVEAFKGQVKEFKMDGESETSQSTNFGSCPLAPKEKVGNVEVHFDPEEEWVEESKKTFDVGLILTSLVDATIGCKQESQNKEENLPLNCAPSFAMAGDSHYILLTNIMHELNIREDYCLDAIANFCESDIGCVDDEVDQHLIADTGVHDSQFISKWQLMKDTFNEANGESNLPTNEQFKSTTKQLGLENMGRPVAPISQAMNSQSTHLWGRLMLEMDENQMVIIKGI